MHDTLYFCYVSNGIVSPSTAEQSSTPHFSKLRSDLRFVTIPDSWSIIAKFDLNPISAGFIC